MPEPLVSVIIPTYNRSQLVCRAISNVIEQTYTNTEIIVVDDGSTDDTPLQLRQFGGRIQLIRQANAGASAARNRGISVAHGEIVAFQDSDDLWESTKLARQVSLLERAGLSVPCCLCNARMEYSTRASTTSFELAPIRPPAEEGLWTNVGEVLVTTTILFNQCVAIRTQALAKAGGFNESMHFMEDYDLALRLAVEGQPWAYIREPMVIWREGSPHSLQQEAIRNETKITEYLLATLERTLLQINHVHRPQLVKLLAREGKNCKRELAWGRLAEKGGIHRAAGGALKRLERYRRAIYRRLPSYPHPRFTSLPDWHDYSADKRDLVSEYGASVVS